MYLTICKIDSYWEVSLEYRELSLVLCDNLEGWEGVGRRFKREWTHVYLWLIPVVVCQKPTQCCKAIILQLKINLKKDNVQIEKDNILSSKKKKKKAQFKPWKTQFSEKSFVPFLPPRANVLFSKPSV